MSQVPPSLLLQAATDSESEPAGGPQAASGSLSKPRSSRPGSSDSWLATGPDRPPSGLRLTPPSGLGLGLTMPLSDFNKPELRASGPGRVTELEHHCHRRDHRPNGPRASSTRPAPNCGQLPRGAPELLLKWAIKQAV